VVSRAVRESALALGGGTLLTLAMKHPVWRDPATTVPADTGDPLLLAWTVGWVGHAATTAPWEVFDSNTFTPLPRSLAFSDALLGLAPLGVVGEGTSAALVRYAVAFLLAYALAFTGVYVLARQLGAGKGAAVVAGAAFAFSPFRLSQSGHLQILSSGGIPLALAMLARGHGLGRRTGGRTDHRWALAGWAVAIWQLSIGFGLGLMFAYLLGALTLGALAVVAVRRPPLPRRLLVADAIGATAFVLAGALLALPYAQVVEDHPNARRDVATVALYSPPLSALVTAPEPSRLYGELTRERREAMRVPPEMTLLPGVVVAVLAVVGLGWPGWSRRRRAGLAAAVIVLAVLALGTSGPFDGRLGYRLLLDHAPGWQGVRTPGRLVTLAWLALALLAAAGVDRLRRLTRTRAASATVVAALAAAVLVEGADRLPQATPRQPPSVALADVPGPVLVLPSDEISDLTTMWWSTDRFPDVVNGGSAFVPRSLAEVRAVAAQLPSPAAFGYLRGVGVRSIVVVRDQLPGSAYARVLDAPPPAGVTVTSYDDVVVLSLR
jgi:hypothetical protein